MFYTIINIIWWRLFVGWYWKSCQGKLENEAYLIIVHFQIKSKMVIFYPHSFFFTQGDKPQTIALNMLILYMVDIELNGPRASVALTDTVQK